MLKEPKETKRMMLEQNVNKETGTIKRDHIEILELKSTITAMKHSVEEVPADLSRQKSQCLEDRAIEMLQSEEKGKKADEGKL